MQLIKQLQDTFYVSSTVLGTEDTKRIPEVQF